MPVWYLQLGHDRLVSYSYLLVSHNHPPTIQRHISSSVKITSLNSLRTKLLTESHRGFKVKLNVSRRKREITKPCVTFHITLSVARRPTDLFIRSVQPTSESTRNNWVTQPLDLLACSLIVYIWTKWRGCGISQSTSVSTANLHSTNFSAITLTYHPGLVQ
jgi:hypothetical protein